MTTKREAVELVISVLANLAGDAEETGKKIMTFRNGQLEIVTFEELSKAAEIVAGLV